MAEISGVDEDIVGKIGLLSGETGASCSIVGFLPLRAGFALSCVVDLQQ